MNAIKEFALKNGLTIMMAGFLVFFVSFLVFVFSARYSQPLLKQAAFAGAVVGMIIYAIGRTAVFIQRRKKNRQQNNLEGP